MPPSLMKRLTNAELDRLDDFLHRINPGEAMSLEELDGYFCALICCPEVVPPSEYLPHVWGEQYCGGAFKTAEEAQEILTLFSRHWNTIAATLFRDEPYPVLMGEYDDGKITGQEWALGFQQGMFLRKKSWERLLKNGTPGAALLPIMMLAQDDDHHLVSNSVMEEDRDAALDVLADAVLMIYQYFRVGAYTQRRTKKRSAARQ